MGGNGWGLPEAYVRPFQLQKASSEGRGCLVEQYTPGMREALEQDKPGFPHQLGDRMGNSKVFPSLKFQEPGHGGDDVVHGLGDQ